MAPKPNNRNNWIDVQMVIMVGALVLTLVFWNVFAGPDRARALQKQNAQSAASSETTESTNMADLALAPTLEPVKIMLGGADPNSQPQAFVPSAKPKRKGGGGGGGGGGGTGGGGGGGGGGTGGS